MQTSIPFCEVPFKRFQPGLGSTFLPGAQFLLVLKNIKEINIKEKLGGDKDKGCFSVTATAK